MLAVVVFKPRFKINACFVLPLLAAMAVSSCIYEDLPPCEETGSALTIVNDWNFAPSANPEGMAYLFYADGGTDPWRFDFPGRDAGKVPLPEGNYRFVMFNDDTSAVRFRLDGNGDLEAYCRAGSITEGLRGFPVDSDVVYDKEPVEICPDMMWACGTGYVNLTAGGLDYDSFHNTGAEPAQRIYDSEKVLTTLPRQIIARYSYEILNVENLDGVRCMCCAMSGLASSIRLCDAMRSSSAVTLPFQASAHDNNAITGKFFTYGLPQPHDPTLSPNILMLMVWLKDGRRIEYDFDVTSQVTDADNPLDVHIRLAGLKLPEVEGGTEVPGTFDPTVDGWTQIEVNIES